jgi:nucleotide-binding universal stress UspA family protein
MLKIERILCPVDLSDASAEALRYALVLARAYQARLIVCHVAAGSEPLANAPAGRAEGMLANMLAGHLGYGDLARLDWEGVVVGGGDDPAESITRVAAERGADLIVMRSRRRPRAAALLGSTAEDVCRAAPCPVLVTHPRERGWVSEVTSEIDLRHVLVAYDFSTDSELALRYGLSLAQEYQAELHLLHVLPKPAQGEPEIAWTAASVESVYHEAARRLQRAVPAEAHLWCRVRSAVRWGRPYREILAYAAEQEIDLVLMGAQGAGFGLGALFGSNVDRVLRQSPCPVLVARPLKPVAATARAAAAERKVLT